MSRHALALLLALALPMTAMAQKPRRPPKEGVSRSLRALDFELASEQTDILPRQSRDVAVQAPVPQKLGDVDFRQASRKVAEKPLNDELRVQPYRHFMPALSGLTGLIDITAAYTQPKKTYVVTVQRERVRADRTWWRLPYRNIRSDMTFASINYGATPNIEISLDGELWDKDITYNDPRTDTEGPTFSARDRAFLGLGSKYTFPFSTTAIERLWFGLGFRINISNEEDYDYTEVHEHDRFSQIFFTASTKATRELFGHFMVKYVSYDFGGNRAASGRTDTFPGFSPTNAWTQWGLGIEWYLFPDFVLMTELLQDSATVFLDVDSTFNQFNWNVGARYHRENIGIGVFAKRVNHRGLEDNGVQFAVRF
jgi:hypothetical protein